ncbi:adenosylcobinamide-phosphate synthase CbiB [uncultured Litoreibacter sp.]|uniref:adenosylcobinamide-phosphate synthase CbiB n=1 Tax=uncultured Litoreibacter sp. TaxID=1392394 RepID=UPI00261A2B09|nr:adenosylcobinamide-phosphate synthase CbiB [uncultured Litoreibacter sp.]
MTLAAAMLLDALLGEPKWLWDRAPHPAVLIGRLIAWLEVRMNTGARRAMGAVMVAALVLGAWLIGAVIAALPFGWLWSLFLTAILLAQRSLADHVRDVGNALRLSLGDGRAAVAKIVGRDTRGMDGSAVARSAIESGAENLSDGVIAPAFWFLVAGLPGILIYKVINTADSMVGYRNHRYEEFGWASAKLDDAVNWIPARLTAALIVAAHMRWDVWAVVRRDAGLHRSPNAGWPEAAMAGVLGTALSGPRSYDGEMREFPFVYPEGRHQVTANDIDACISVLWRAWALCLGLVVVAAVLF